MDWKSEFAVENIKNCRVNLNFVFDVIDLINLLERKKHTSARAKI
jgi:hypothetical protein